MRIRLNNVRHARRIPDSSAPLPPPPPPPLPVPFYARMEEAARETTDERRRYDDEAFSLSASAFCVASAGKTNPSEKTWDDNQGQSEDMKRNIRCVYVSKM